MWSLARRLLRKTCFETRGSVPKVPILVSYPPHVEPHKVSLEDHVWVVIKGISHKAGQGAGSAEERGRENIVYGILVCLQTKDAQPL
jgi:hypothetical protein